MSVLTREVRTLRLLLVLSMLFVTAEPVRIFVFVSRTMNPEGGWYGERTEVYEGTAG
jgi:hypothetical protein